MNFNSIFNRQASQKDTRGKLRFDTIRTSPYKFSNKGKFSKNEL